MSEQHYDKTFDATGLKCPMPVVKARKQVHDLEPGQVLKVVCTDRGSVKDFQGWAKVDRKVSLLGQETLDNEGAETFVHFVQLEA